MHGTTRRPAQNSWKPPAGVFVGLLEVEPTTERCGARGGFCAEGSSWSTLDTSVELRMARLSPARLRRSFRASIIVGEMMTNPAHSLDGGGSSLLHIVRPWPAASDEHPSATGRG